jgi:DNA-directed RNA polymerase subunit RPC12/RpoP
MYVRVCPICGYNVQAMRHGVSHCPSCGEAILFNGKARTSRVEMPGGESDDNRRAYHRFITSGRVLVRPLLPEGEPPAAYQVGRLENLSGGGAFVVSENLPEPGGDIEVVLAVSDRSLMRLTAAVRHRRAIDDELTAGGVEFTEITPPVRQCVTATARRMSAQKQVS